ncbi:hypothetical protein QFC21_005548 [Naganishia friedmannii]|uniref:Uncharacterized protein n=1 Tax=Naganishia friedmannii TaxID=89922 RepID=A0ACC2V9D0_9TREE|nr:hypothetical protein QFC21_005548 [Naganishia friedmannii]
MCHISPTATLFSAVLATCGTLCMAYHAWQYNRFKCLWFKKEETFRWIVMLTAGQITATYVKYNEYYVYIPKVGIKVKPYPLWSAHHRELFKGSYWLMAVGIVLLLAVHLEEVLVSLQDGGRDAGEGRDVAAAGIKQLASPRSTPIR